MKIALLIIAFSLLSCGMNSGKPENSSSNTSPIVQKNLSSSPAEEGQNLYLKYCMACHQKDGSGVPGMYPPLSKADWVQGDKKRIIHVVLYGIQGEITVNGQTYRQVMPKQDFLTDSQIARILTYLRQNLGNKADSVKVKEVADIRKAGI